MKKNYILKIIALLKLLFLCSLEASGQETNLPSDFASLDEMSTYFNSSIFNTSPSINLGNQIRLNSSSDFRQFYLFGGGKLGKKNKRGIGFGALISQDGPILTENRVNASYWTNIKLSNNSILSLSTQIGIINQSIKATKSTPDINLFTPELNIGASLSIKNTQIGVSANQLGRFNRKLTYTSIAYPVFYTIHFNQKISLSPQVVLNITGDSRIVSKSLYLVRVKPHLTFYKVIDAGVSIGTDGVSGSLKWQNIPFLRKKGFVSFTYLAPLFQKRIRLFTPFQINLGYLLPNE